MIISMADMWLDIKHNIDLMLVTTNGYVQGVGRDNQHLVMGKGAARQATLFYPHIAEDAAELIVNGGYPRPAAKQPIYLYGFVCLRTPPRDAVFNYNIGLLQTKFYYGDKSSVNLIGYSLTKLQVWMLQNKTKIVGLNFPGIGLGGLERETVFPLLAEFDDNLVVFET